MLSHPEQPINNGIGENPESKRADAIYWWLGLILLIAGLFGTWTNHFAGGFHQDDVHVIVENPAIQSASIGRILTSPRAASTLAEYSAWRPLTMLTWAFDYSIRGANPAIFHGDSFVWFLLVLIGVYTIARLLPNSNRYSALFAASILAFHPLTADLLNYISHRYLILRALGLLFALVLFDAWPHRMPATIWFNLRRIPVSQWDILKRRIRTLVSDGWKVLIGLPVPWYFFPLVLGLLADPGTAVFPLILIVWIKLFDPKRSLRDVLPSGILCGVWWLAHTIVTFAPTTPLRQPVLAWWWTQPWVVLRYLKAFLIPFRLAADSTLQVFRTPFSIEAMAGIVGVGALIFFTVRASRYEEWKVVSFGLSWFLIALLPDFIIPLGNVEELSRAFVPIIGLSIAASAILWMAVARFRQSGHWRLPGIGAVATVAIAALTVLALQAHERNSLWESETDFWSNLLERSPSNPHALLKYGRAQIISGDAEAGYKNLEKARTLQPQNAETELNLALYAEPAGRNDSEEHFKRAMTLAPSSPVILAAYSDWLLLKSRNKEAFQLATKAIALDPYSAPGRRAMMNVELSNRQWSEALAFGKRTLDLLPANPDALRVINVATNALDEMATSEKRAKTDPSVDNFLQLSIVQMQNGHFEEGIESCRDALKIKPDLAEAWSNISVGYHMLGKTDDSIAALREAIRLRPDLPNLKQNLEAEIASKAVREARLGTEPSIK